MTSALNRLPALEPLPLPADVARLLERLDAPPPLGAVATALAYAWTHAPFLRGLIRGRSEALATFLRLGPEAAEAAALQHARDGDEPAGLRLRQAKADIALVTALADIAGLWPLERVTRTLSDFADLALDLAVRTAIAERVPGAGPDGFAVLALGKLGSHELNYSSDVDLILLYDRDRLARREREEADQAAVRIARRLVELMQARDAAGYVFRVDLRLRPSPEATPIALPVGAAESYYQSEALAWERAAFIRARAVAGDIALGEAFLSAIRPFVWRRSLDYSAIREIQDISLRIRDHFKERQKVGPGFDIKRGRGGIREVEFYAQIHQMIYGGREPALRTPATFEALAALADADRIDRADAALLADGYRTLRTIEHRLQMRADEQTHQIPTAAQARTTLAQFCGFDGWRAMERYLAGVTRAVAARYDRLVEEAEEDRLPRDHQALVQHLRKARFADPESAAKLIDGWRFGRYRALRSTEAQTAFETVLPKLITALGAAADNKAAIIRFDSFLAQLPAGLQFFALLGANPRLVGLLGRLLGVTSVLADALARTPDLLDILLDPGAFEPLPAPQELKAELATLVKGAAHLEETLDRVRRWTAERRFQIGAHLIEGIADPLDAARSYAALADAAFEVLARAVGDAFAATHGHVPGGRLVVLGLGRYGGQALTARSDLDIVYLFSGAYDAESDGPKPLAATHYFNRLAQRLTAALSVPTAAGALYEIDTRLRPSGTQGFLAVTIDTFARYQLEQAWTWEHMALTRARVILGSAEDQAAVAAAIAAALGRPQDPAKLRDDVLSMRAEMDQHRPGAGLWDVKLGTGGLVDLEFIIHYLQLRERTALTSDLRAAIADLTEAELLPPDFIEAHDLLTRTLVMLRLVVPDTSGKVEKLPPSVQTLLAKATGHQDFKALEAALRLAKGRVAAAWESAFGVPRKGAKRKSASA